MANSFVHALRRRGSWLLGPPSTAVTIGSLVGAVLLAWSAGIHLGLWSASYHEIPTIGPLFLSQGIAGALMALLLATVRRPLFAAAGALFALGTVAGLLLSVNVGLFGFQDSMLAPYAKQSLVIELCAVAVMAATVVAGALSSHRAAAAAVLQPGSAHA